MNANVIDDSIFDTPIYVGKRPPRYLGGVGSGNFGHAGRPGEVGGSAPASGGSATGVIEPAKDNSKAEAARQYHELKAEWSRINDKLFEHVDRPDSPEAKAIIEQQKALVKQMHKLDADPGGVEGVKLPGGPRDVVIVGAGPGGLAAAVMSGAEGLDTLMVEATPEGGGQAKHSSRVENLPGFPAGITGERLASQMKEQAHRMGAESKYGVRVTSLSYDPDTDLKTLTLSDGSQVVTRAVVMAGGIEVNTAPWDPKDNTVTYLDSRALANQGTGKHVVVAGGSNGAAQAALLAAKTAEHVTVVSRSPIEKAMSDYQINALYNHPKVTVKVQDISSLRNKVMTFKDGTTVKADAVGVFYGGRSKTDWLPTQIKRESQTGKIITNDGLETDLPGVFAVGDMRHGSIGRIGTSIGDGQLATSSLFRYYERASRIEGAFKRK